MLSRSHIVGLFEEPKMFADPSFSPDGFLREFGEAVLCGVMRANKVVIDASSWRFDGDDDVFTVLVSKMHLVFYAFNLGGPAAPNTSLKHDFIARASESDKVQRGGLLSDVFHAAVSIILVHNESGPSGQYELCEQRLIGWYMARIERARPANE